MSSQGGLIDEYCEGNQMHDEVLNIMVGDFQRLVEYPKRGFQTAQLITAKQYNAFKRLVLGGFAEHPVL